MTTAVKTAVVFETTESTDLYIVDGDLIRFDGVIVNVTDTGFEEELGTYDFGSPVNSREFKLAILDGAEFVHCGFMY